ncbi:trihelix transcription factor ASR3 [Coffea arabica]|uniref:Trihelix transcription factor ASR3 n=1 Tax=Coffea arabica TaxID=13443 RepID=A0A6P6VB76_COFAR
MALEQLSLAVAAAPPHSDSPSPSPALNGRQPSTTALDPHKDDDSAKVPRLPRWTRQEILVLIQGKRVAENRVRRGRTAGLAFGSAHVEPKWASVSSYCKRHGVNRGPVQCRKRWSNLAGDFKKIKEWESQIREETDSFWLMRNDLRRERKLPGFFDREVYDILDGGGRADGATPAAEEGAEELVLALAPSAAEGPEEADAETEAVFDSGRSAAADDGLFSDFEQSVQEEVVGTPDKEFRPANDTPVTAVPAPTPISEKQYQPISQGHPAQGTSYEKQPSLNPEIGSTQEGKKRKRYIAEVDEQDEMKTLHDQLIEAFERNGKLLSSQLESQNVHLQLDREQRKDQANSLISVLHKLADALGRIADKL